MNKCIYFPTLSAFSTYSKWHSHNHHSFTFTCIVPRIKVECNPKKSLMCFSPSFQLSRRLLPSYSARINEEFPNAKSSACPLILFLILVTFRTQTSWALTVLFWEMCFLFQSTGETKQKNWRTGHIKNHSLHSGCQKTLHFTNKHSLMTFFGRQAPAYPSRHHSLPSAYPPGHISKQRISYRQWNCLEDTVKALQNI